MAKRGKQKPKILGPRTEQEKKFCERWLHHFDKDRAWREAGYYTGAGSAHAANAKLEKFADYLRPIREAKARLIAEKLAIDADAVLANMVKRVFYDPTEFYEITSEPLTEMHKPKGAKAPVERIREWDSKPIYGERMKPYSELTPEQRQVVEVTGESGGVIRYRLPTIREQHMFLTSLGRQFGMFLDKLVLERHDHRHVHQHLTFEGVPTQRLQRLTQELLPLVGLEFAQQLGYTAEDLAEAERATGVLMPAKTG